MAVGPRLRHHDDSHRPSHGGDDRDRRPGTLELERGQPEMEGLSSDSESRSGSVEESLSVCGTRLHQRRRGAVVQVSGPKLARV